ncbi:MAG: zinc-dependent metalloprotease family protein [Verrucomicrobiota bacterium]
MEPPQAITHKVVVQPIRVRDTATGPIANFFGTPSSEAYIKDQINVIWAQVGVEIEWLEVIEYTDRFAYDGYPTNYTNVARPQSHLSTIRNNAGVPPKSTNPIELNFFFVEISAGFNKLSQYSVAGLASVDGNGSTVYVGGGLLTWPDGRDVVAGVVAHEIGHNLGLFHYQADQSNLMYSGNGDGEELIASQDTIIFTNNGGYDGYDFLQELQDDSFYLIWSDSFNLQEGPGGDDDKDGLSNAFEFLQGSSPVAFTPLPESTSTAEGPVWTFNKQAEAVAEGYSFEAESSLDLDDWRVADNPTGHSTVLVDNDDTFSVRLDGGLTQAFIRFDVNLPPAAGMAGLLPPDLQGIGEAGPEVFSCCGVGSCGIRTLVGP